VLVAGGKVVGGEVVLVPGGPGGNEVVLADAGNVVLVADTGKVVVSTLINSVLYLTLVFDCTLRTGTLLITGVADI